MIKSNLQNLTIIKDSIRELYTRLGAEQIKAFANDYKMQDIYKPHLEPVIEVQNIAKEISKYYHLRIGTILVSFITNIDCPGRVELSRSNDFFIELNSKHKSHYDEITAILAHEITHIFLHRLGISFKNTYENEILTDTTAAYLGFGQAMISSFKISNYYDVYQRNIIEKKYIGYIIPNEIGYIVGKRNLFFKNKNVNEYPHSFEWGIERAHHDSRNAPYCSAPIVSKYLYKIQKLMFTKIKGKGRVHKSLASFQKYGYYFDSVLNPNIVFDCLNCFQKLRLRLNQKNVKIRCPLCKGEYLCST